MSRQFADLQLGSIELFCLAAEAGSFTEAAHLAGLTPAAVSRAISRLETRLAARLFVRTTRQIRLTPTGAAYFKQCRAALQQIIAAESNATDEQRHLRGVLRISLPTAYAHYRVLPLLPAFRERYPDVHLDLHISNRNIDFAEENFDVVIRGRAQTDSGLVARKLEDAELVVAAAPAYLKRAGVPTSVEDLQHHQCIQFVLPRDGRHVPWLFTQQRKAFEVLTAGAYCCSDDILGTATLARNGAGVAQIYRFVVEDDLRSGRLVELLKPFGNRSRPFSVLYPHRTHAPARVRIFVEFLIAALVRRSANGKSPSSARPASRPANANRNNR